MSHRAEVSPGTSGTTSGTRGTGGTRTDIQGLRAIAVSMVLVYHLWPDRFPGGFVGVDAFFVISGFLITSHLLGTPPRTPVDLLRFWSRRIRRLLPAALLVLTVTLVASRLLAPDTQWENTAKQGRAAALYIVNWRLADDAVDYLASENKPTPVQHFWSLSVEEQFYLVWPMLILLLVLAAVFLRSGRRAVVATGLAAVVAASLWYSIHETADDPARAFFVTPTRIWELGVGGLLAAVVVGTRAVGRIPDVGRSVLAVAGIAGLVWTGIAFDGGTPFPSWRALAPVLTTALVIFVRAPDTGRRPGRLLATRPVQWLGDVSYSLYLWHWPLIVLGPCLCDGSLDPVQKLAVLAASLVLAGITKPLVEDRFRRAEWGRPLVKPYALGAVAMAVVVAGAALQIHEVAQRDQQANERLQHQLAQLNRPVPAPSAPAASGSARSPSAVPTTPTVPRSCLGAPALTPSFGCTAITRTGSLVPSPLRAASDKSDAYGSVNGRSDCFAYAPTFRLLTCTRGDPRGKVRVALVGNSHAGQWFPALERVATQQHWRITSYVASQCAFARTTQKFSTTAAAHGCDRWVKRVQQAVIAGHYGLVVMTNRISVAAAGLTRSTSYPAYERGYLSVLRAFTAAHLKVVGVRDTPKPDSIIPDCLADHTGDYRACAGMRSEWLPAEPLAGAIRELGDPHVLLADLTDWICRGSVCPGAVGRVPLYFDSSHLSATYALTLAPYLQPYLLRALKA